MNVNDIEEKVRDMELEIEAFTSQYNMDEMKNNRTKYSRVIKSNQQDYIPSSEMEILRKDNSVLDTFRRKTNKLRHLQQFLSHIIQHQSQGCQNFKRKDPPSEQSGMVQYDLEFILQPQNSLIKRQSFRFVGIDNYSEETVILFLECSEFLTNKEANIVKSFENVWPYFVWNLLSDKEILDVYGVYVWILLPEKWRYWWLDAVHRCDIFEDVTIDNPSAFFQISLITFMI